MVCSHSLQLWKRIECIQCSHMHRTIWESHLLIKTVVNPQTDCVNTAKNINSFPGTNLYLTQSDLQAKRYAESLIQRLQWVTCLEKSTKALFLIQSLGRYCRDHSCWYLQRNKRSNFTRLPFETTIIIFPVIMSKVLAISMSWSFDILICPSPIKGFWVHYCKWAALPSCFCRVWILLIVIIWR